MNFISIYYALFLLATFLAFVMLPPRYRKILLLLASYVFYGTWSIPLIAVILISTTTDYGFSQIISKSQSALVRKISLISGLLLNLAVLGFFKYYNFFLDSGYQLIRLFDASVVPPSALSIILPLGISFYTFEAISYLVDVYRGKAPATSLLNYNFYIMYFPHLISGPIIRFCELFPQYETPIQLASFERMRQGLVLILLGVIFKVLLADQAAPMSDDLFNHPATSSVLNTYIGVLAFTVQIWFDFMGYTHIARGSSLFFNIEMPLNFNYPYLASNISNFWERWHISLSRWIRDYLYFPLGGSHGSLMQTCVNLLLTMLIAGAWHGAGWTYISWGGYHGLLLAFYHLYKHYRLSLFGIEEHGAKANKPYRWASWGLTFALVVYGWVLFRSPDLGTAVIITQSLAQVGLLGKEITNALTSGHCSSLLTLVYLVACCVAGPWLIRIVSERFEPMPLWLKIHAACLLIILCWMMSAESVQPFIYFQF